MTGISPDPHWFQKYLEFRCDDCGSEYRLPLASPDLFRTLPSADFSSAARALRGMLSAGLSFDLHAGERPVAGSGEKGTNVRRRDPTVTLPSRVGRRYTANTSRESQSHPLPERLCRVIRRPSSAVVRTEFGLAKPKLQWQALLLLPGPVRLPSAPIAIVHTGLYRPWVGASAESLFAVLFPSDCRICGAPLFKISRLPVCQECLDAIRPISGSVCAICGERIFSPYALSSSGGEPRCGLCRRIEPAFVRATAYGSYESGLRELIQLLKYGGVRPAANVLGRMLAEAIAKLEPELPSDLWR